MKQGQKPVFLPERITADELRRVPLLAGVPQADLQALADQARRVRMPAGAYLHRAGEVATYRYLLLTGCLAVVTSSQAGIRMAELALPGQILGVSSLPRSSDDAGIYFSDVLTIVDSDLCCLATGQVMASIQAGGPLAASFAFFIADRLGRLYSNFIELAGRSVNYRVAHVLLALQSALGSSTLSITQYLLADLVGATREATAESLSRLRRRGWIATSRGRLEILDRDALVRHLELAS